MNKQQIQSNNYDCNWIRLYAYIYTTYVYSQIIMNRSGHSEISIPSLFHPPTWFMMKQERLTHSQSLKENEEWNGYWLSGWWIKYYIFIINRFALFAIMRQFFILIDKSNTYIFPSNNCSNIKNQRIIVVHRLSNISYGLRNGIISHLFCEFIRQRDSHLSFLLDSCWNVFIPECMNSSKAGAT